MFALLNWRLWAGIALAIALAASHAMAYRTGKATVRADWDRDIAERTTKALQAEQAARAKEQELLTARQKAEERYAAEKKRSQAAAAGAQSELDGLRNDLAALGASQPTADPATPARTDGAGGLELQLLGSCATALADLAIQADRLENKVVGLQDYIKAVLTNTRN